VRALALSTACVATLAWTPAARGADGPAARPPEPLVDYWQGGAPRPFVSSRIEGGIIYAKPQVAVGYGQPYWTWIGIEAYPMTTNSFFAGYVGIRAALPFLSLSFGARDSYSYYRSFLPPGDHYVSDDLSSLNGAHARYVAIEAEVSTVLPVPGGYTLAAATVYAITGVPEHKYVFDESLRGIVKPPYIWALRLAYLAGLGKNDVVKVGVLAELVGLPGRDQLVFRSGPVLSVTITDHTDAIGVFSPVFVSPDSLGLWHGTFGQLGFRYRWATGDSGAQFP
jgi:hypothetical protein